MNDWVWDLDNAIADLEARKKAVNEKLCYLLGSVDRVGAGWSEDYQGTAETA